MRLFEVFIKERPVDRHHLLCEILWSAVAAALDRVHRYFHAGFLQGVRQLLTLFDRD